MDTDKSTEAITSNEPPDRVPIGQQIRCIARELALRRNCYPRWVKSGKMKQFEADRELESMEAVLETLKRLEPPF
jgi:hypothetical protein